MQEPNLLIPQPNQNNYIYIATIIIIPIILIVTIVTMPHLLFSKPTQEIPQVQPKLSPILAKVQKCATKNQTQICQALYSTPDIEAKCLKLDKEKDQCLYNFVIINKRPGVCGEITNQELKSECKKQALELLVSE